MFGGTFPTQKSTLCRLEDRNRAGEMAQWLRTLTPLPKVLSSNLSNHMVAHNQPIQAYGDQGVECDGLFMLSPGRGTIRLMLE